jgi:pimeloyl-ACP methyl ester carboxylesterase
VATSVGCAFVATFVLVHGAGHGGWCWRRVTPILRAAGHDVHAPTLTGLGEREHLLDARVGLDLHILDVVNVLRFEDLHDVVLVGHSYGGPVVTGAADRARDRVAKLVYLDAAYVPSGSSVADAFGGGLDALRAAGTTVDEIEVILVPTADGGPYFGVTDPADQGWMAGRLTAFPWQCFAQPLHLDDPDAVAALPTFHIVCTAGASNADPLVMAQARANGRLWELATHHEAMISEPEQLAAALLEIAAR